MNCSTKETDYERVRLILADGEQPVTFSAGGCKRHDRGAGEVIVNGQIRMNDGTLCHALLEIDENSSGEHGGTGVFYINKEGQCDVVFQGDKKFLKLLGKTEEEIFPYKYKYATGTVFGRDIHLGEDGWSHR